MKRIISLFLCLLLTFSLMAPAFAEAAVETPAANIVVTDDGLEMTVVGEGETAFGLLVIDGEGNMSAFCVLTNEKTVGAALSALGMIEGEQSAYGLYVKTVCGITADYDVDKTYWAFYINEDYAMTGVDSTEIDEDTVYTLKVEAA